MRYVFLMLLVLISGCVLNQPQSFVFNEVHTSNVSNVITKTSTKTIKETPAPRPAAVIVKTEPHTTKTTCGRFELPPAGDIPIRPLFSDPELKSKTDLDVILTEHIKSLEAHAIAERKRIETAYYDWLRTCK